MRADLGSMVMQGPIIEVKKLMNINFQNSPSLLCNDDFCHLALYCPKNELVQNMTA